MAEHCTHCFCMQDCVGRQLMPRLSYHMLYHLSHDTAKTWYQRASSSHQDVNARKALPALIL